MTKATIVTKHGNIEIELFEKEAPNTVKNFITLAKSKFYDGLKFHRVIDGFVIQGGCPEGSGRGGPGYSIKCEINKQKHLPGSLSMAHAGKDTGGSQFFITHTSLPHLDGVHTVFGRTDNMDVVLSVRQGDLIEKITIVD